MLGVSQWVPCLWQGDTGIAACLCPSRGAPARARVPQDLPGTVLGLGAGAGAPEPQLAVVGTWPSMLGIGR